MDCVTSVGLVCVPVCSSGSIWSWIYWSCCPLPENQGYTLAFPYESSMNKACTCTLVQHCTNFIRTQVSACISRIRMHPQIPVILIAWSIIDCSTFTLLENTHCHMNIHAIFMFLLCISAYCLYTHSGVHLNCALCHSSHTFIWLSTDCRHVILMCWEKHAMQLSAAGVKHFSIFMFPLILHYCSKVWDNVFNEVSRAHQGCIIK